MAKVAIIVDKRNSAIDILANGVKKYNPHHDIKIVDVHPKRPSFDQIENVKKAVKEAEIVDFQYFKTALMLLEEYSHLFKDKRKILQHHNPYSINEDNWAWADVVVTNNKSIREEIFETQELPTELIYNSVDFEMFDYKEKYEWNKTVGMIAGRIESKKGIKEVANLCEKLKIKFILVGRISNKNYFDSFSKNTTLDFRENISDTEKRKAIHEMGALIVNSDDGFESGPIPPLEAMASGIPVISRSVGMMKDILKHGNNSLMFDTLDDLKGILISLDEKHLNKIRDNAWEQAKRFDDKRRAREYSKIYYSLANDHQRIVSVIIPTANRIENVVKIVASLETQSYKHLEIVIADDGDKKIGKNVIDMLRNKSSYPIKYIKITGSGYQLARARNEAVVEAEGEYLLFVDDRLQPHQRAIENFLDNMSYEKEWLFGNKGADKKNFVENFSFIRRTTFVEAGMFNMLFNKYGGISQEVRTRFKRQNFQLRYIRSAKCDVLNGTHKTIARRKDIYQMKYLLYKLYEA